MSLSNSIFNLKHDLRFNHDIKKDDYLKLRLTSSSTDNKNQSGEILFQVAQVSATADEEITLEHNLLNYFHK